MPNCCDGVNPWAVNNPDFIQLRQFESYARKRFKLHLLASCFDNARPEPAIPSRAIGLSLGGYAK